MQADKVTVIIKFETLDIHSVPALAAQAIEKIANEFECGHLVASDGDRVEWNTTRTNVTF